MPKPKKAILLRIPAELATRLSHWAQDELRSVNAQIEYLLREAVRKRYGARAVADAGDPEDAPGDEPRPNNDEGAA